MTDKPKKKPDKAIKLSNEVLQVLNHKRKRLRNRRKSQFREPYDSLFRRLLGMMSRDGKKSNQTETFYILTKPKLQVFRDHAEAKGWAILNAVRVNSSKAERPVAVREII